MVRRLRDGRADASVRLGVDAARCLGDWLPSLRFAVSACLRSSSPMAVYWGPDLVCVHNDAERGMLEGLHPDALGRPASQVFNDSWDVTGPRLEGIVRGEPVWADAEPLLIELAGVPEFEYATYSSSPLIDDFGDIGGVLLVPQDPGPRAHAERGGALVDELQSLVNGLRKAQRRAAEARDIERRRIEQNLHDGAQQRLISLRLELGLLAEMIEHEPASAIERLAELRSDFDEALDELRELAHGLYPPVLASDGLLVALKSMSRNRAVPITLQSIGLRRVTPSIESAAYFCCAEAVNNATKHGGPGVRITIRVGMTENQLSFVIRDDGCGFDPRAAAGGSAAAGPTGQGLANLRDRLEALGGQVTIISTPGRGTTVSGDIPLS